jgi:hypothetical protein
MWFALDAPASPPTLHYGFNQRKTRYSPLHARSRTETGIYRQVIFTRSRYGTNASLLFWKYCSSFPFSSARQIIGAMYGRIDDIQQIIDFLVEK